MARKASSLMDQMTFSMYPELTLELLKQAAKAFATDITDRPIPELFGVTDGKAVGTYIEQSFRSYLKNRFTFLAGNSASGIDLPDLQIDLKTTSISQPQSSCPFKDASQKVYGLGYDLLIFVYDKRDDHASHTAILKILHTIFVERSRTADWQTTMGIAGILDRNGNKDDLVGFLEERNLPLDEIGRTQLAERILRQRPAIGYLTISNALQWRLQYNRAIEIASKVEGVERLNE
jgi:hypothetical protein